MKKMALTRVSAEDLERLCKARALSVEATVDELATKIEERWESLTVEGRLRKVVFKIRPSPGRNAGWIDQVIRGLLARKPDGFEVVVIRGGDVDYQGYFGQTGCDDFGDYTLDREPDVEV